MRKTLMRLTALCLLALAVAIPNSLQVETAAALVATAGLSLAGTRLLGRLRPVFLLFVGSTLVTLFYMAVGTINGAPDEAMRQITIIYIAGPLLWIVAMDGVLRIWDQDSFVKILAAIALLACATVGLFYYLFINFGPSAVEFFKKGANVNLTDGYAGATMHVYGPLMFLTAAFFAAPEVIANRVFRYGLLGCLALVAASSGRSALMLATVVGMGIGFLVGGQSRPPQTGRRKGKAGRLTFAAQILAVVSIFLLGLGHFSDIDLLFVAEHHFGELLSAGGTARTEQADALIQGISHTNGLGAGHGIGVAYLRSDDFPWRYELVWLATVFRTGILGAAIYAAVFVYYIASFVRLALAKKMHPIDVFMFSGFIAAFIASNTNPYIESISMQWMYILPIVHFFTTRHAPVSRRIVFTNIRTNA